jgi:hypothetical protein
VTRETWQAGAVTSAATPAPKTAAYAETLWPPAAWWGGGFALCVATWWIVFVAASVAVAWTSAAVAALGVFGWLRSYGGVDLVVDERGLRADSAVLPWRYVGPATACDPAETRRLLGVRADARAHLLIRPYIACAVRVTVDDDRDPAPYWLISTRRPDEVAARLNAAAMSD